MRRQYIVKTILLLIVVGAPGSKILSSQQPEPVSMSIDEFRGLSPDEQKAVIAAAFERRVQHARNLFVETTRIVNNYANENGRLGAKVVEGTFRRVQQWRLGGSYRMDTHTHWPRDNAFVPATIVSSGFDADEGIGRYTSRSLDSDRASGRVDVIHDSITTDDRYLYWLEGEFEDKGDYLFPNLLQHQESWTIEAPVEGDKVQLVSEWRLWWFRESGERKLLLDPNRAFLPLKGTSRWNTVSKSGKPRWRTEEFIVEESRLVGDVWMPIKLEERINASSIPDQISKYEIEVTRIEHGSVTPKDLKVQFTEGMRIIDAIKGVAYTVDAEENPVGPIQRLIRDE